LQSFCCVELKYSQDFANFLLIVMEVVNFCLLVTGRMCMVPPCILISQPFIFAGTTLIHTYQLLHQPLMGVARSNVSTSPDACLSSYNSSFFSIMFLGHKCYMRTVNICFYFCVNSLALVLMEREGSLKAMCCWYLLRTCNML
jgi:hypothetical protein